MRSQPLRAPRARVPAARARRFGSAVPTPVPTRRPLRVLGLENEKQPPVQTLSDQLQGQQEVCFGVKDLPTKDLILQIYYSLYVKHV